MTAKIFISHSSNDRKAAKSICAALEHRGLVCWLASRDVGPGQNYMDAIVRAIRGAKVMVLVFSQNANGSNEILKELSLASKYKVNVIPARIEDVVPSEAYELEFATRQWIDLFDDWELEIERLTSWISTIVSIEPDSIVTAKPVDAEAGSPPAPQPPQAIQIPSPPVQPAPVPIAQPPIVQKAEVASVEISEAPPPLRDAARSQAAPPRKVEVGGTPAAMLMRHRGAIGILAIAIALIGWIGWSTVRSNQMAEEQKKADAAYVSANAQICANKFRHDADAAVNLITLKKLDSWLRGDFIRKGGWAIVDASRGPDYYVANACAELLAIS